MSKNLALKYRPRLFKEVVGQPLQVKALQTVIADQSSQAFCFSGPSGVGKTTLARICSRELGVEDVNVLELDAATHTGVEQMRVLVENIRYKAFGKSTGRAVIVDEAHRLSGSAWDSLLKIVEEPPEHLVWFFCTTLIDKVPKTIRTRCTVLTLKDIDDDTLMDLLDDVCGLEKIDMADDIARLVVREAHGSARQLLVNLAACRNVKNKREAADLLRTAIETDATLELCRFLMKGGSWVKAMQHVEACEGASPEGVRIVVCNYLAAVLKKASNERSAAHALGLLDAFSIPYNPSEGMAPLYLSIGRALYQNE